MRKFGKILPGAMAACMALSVVSVPAKADAAATDSSDAVVEETEKVNEAESTEYKLVFNEEFNDSYDSEEFRSKWNVELHDAGWVNDEWQEYVDSEENIEIKDGVLKINPVKKEEVIEVASGNILTNADFASGMDGWTETIANWGGDYVADASSSASNGTIKYTIKNPGTDVWNVQLKQGVELKDGVKYLLTFTVKSDVDRSIMSGVQRDGSSDNDYADYGSATTKLEAGKETKVSILVDKEDYDPANLFISLGKGKENTDVPDESVVTISNIVLKEAPLKNVLKNSDFASGMDGWTETIANWGGDYVADASSSTSNGAIKYTIKNPGTDVWNVQLKQGVELEDGVKYVLTYKVKSDVDRSIMSGVQRDGSSDNDYADYGSATTELKAGKETTVSIVVDKEDYDPANLYISLGKGKENTDVPDESVVTISDIKLLDTTKIVEDTDTEAKVTTTYTSGRISTQNKETFTYGKFECRAKVPSSVGYLPAFWLMANDESVYGQWPRCGEIDIMEIMGGDTKNLYGTIHYGLPKGSKQGTFNDGTDLSKDFHTYTCEWEPGKITWYIDGSEYFTTNDWYSATEGQGTLTYPAPFDQPFYIILNLAIGNEWAGRPDETTSYDESFEVDYVKVYQKDESTYAEQEAEAKAPENKFVPRDTDEDGNYIINGKFETEDLTDKKDWVFLNALGGSSTATIANNEITIDIADQGTVDYSNQLVQAQVPLEQGATYEISFDASATGEISTMNVDVKAPDYNYASYMTTFKPTLSDETETFTTQFKMSSKSDANGRLEFNMGKFGTGTIKISNVSIKKIKDADPEELNKKTVLANGNYIYNGKFEEGEKHLGYWDITEGADVVVSSLSDGRRCIVTNTEAKEITLSQSDLAFTQGKTLAFSFDAKTTHDQTVEATIGGNKYTFNITGDGNKAEYKVKLPSTTEFTDKTVTLKLTNSISIDNVMLCEDALIKNGDFSNGMTGFETYFDAAGSATAGIDALSNGGNDALQVTVNNTGTQDWHLQVMQRNVKLENGKKYRLTYDAKSTKDREIRVVLQGLEARNYEVYSEHATDENANDGIVSLTSEYQTFTEEFEMTAETDEIAQLSICYGAVNGNVIDEQHIVTVDNIVLEEIADEEQKEPEQEDPEQEEPEQQDPEKEDPEQENTEQKDPEKQEPEKKEPTKIAKPVADTTVYQYDGKEKTYGIKATADYTVTNNKKTLIGAQTVTVSLKDKKNTVWADGTTADLTFRFEIVGTAEYDNNFDVHENLKGICQMPYKDGGYLIGLETKGNAKYAELLILDCTLLAEGKPAWVWSTGKRDVSKDNCMWAVWQPQYGYYWTLFRLYDEKGELIEQVCYGFTNI